jgi:ribonuclease-3
MKNIISNIDKLQKSLSYNFKSMDLLLMSLTHKSSKNKPHNERLEFLGDSVVNLIIGEYIYHKFNSYPEGKLSKLRASLVNEDSLMLMAQHINLGDYIFLSKGEQKNNGKEKPSILSDALEAVIGAIFLETNLETTKKIVLDIVKEVYEDINLEDLYEDYKTLLQEYTQDKGGVVPHYETIQEDGPEHDKIFTVSVSIENNQISIGIGKSKKDAQQNGAQKALKVLNNE